MADPTTAPPPNPGPMGRPSVAPPTAGEAVRATISRAQFSTAIVVGVSSGLAVPGNAPGLGLALTGSVAAFAVVANRRGTGRAATWRLATATLAVVNVVLPAITDAGWVVAWLLLSAAVLAATAAGGGTSWRSLGRGVLRLVPTGFRAAGAVHRAIRAVVPAGGRSSSLTRTLVLTGVLLLGFGGLFVSADERFASLVERFLLPDLDLPALVARLALFVVGLIGVTTLTLLRADRAEPDYPPPPRGYLRGIEWQVPLAGLVLLFAAFVAVQFSVLFGGHERVLQTAGVTYAGHARAGFAQLLVVAALTLAVVGGAVRYSLPTGPQQFRLRRVLLGALCVLTLVVLASSLDRLHLYEEAFGSTRLRLGAQAIAWGLGALFVLIMLAAATRRTRWLPPGVVLLGGVAVLTFALIQPDAVIARANVERFDSTGRIDTSYLDGLSADAVPALLELPPDLHGCVLSRQAQRLADDGTGGWGALNLSRSRASARLADAPLSCSHDGPDQRSWSAPVGR